jgi:hypothetical protein
MIGVVRWKPDGDDDNDVGVGEASTTATEKEADDVRRQQRKYMAAGTLPL